MTRGEVLAGAALATAVFVGVTANGCVPESAVVNGGSTETYGPGSMLTPEGECYPATQAIVLDQNGDRVAIGVKDLSVSGSIFRTPEQAIEDELLVEAVGRVGTTDVTEVVFSNGRYHDGVIEVVDGLVFDETLEAGEEFRVDVEDMRDDEGTTSLTFEIREAELKSTLTVEPVSDDPADGVRVSHDQDCETFAPVAD